MAITKEPGQKGVSWSNIAVGAIMNMVCFFAAHIVRYRLLIDASLASLLSYRGECIHGTVFPKTLSLTEKLQVTTLGQPLEVLKTQMAANRSQTMFQAIQTVWSRGGVTGFYQGLIPWAWIEASTKGAVLLFTASEVETAATSMGVSPAVAGLLGGMSGGIVQAYATMGFCTCMKTAEITRHKQAAAGITPPSTWAVFADIYRREGIAGINKGVNAVAVRQCTNWGSRMGFARLAESSIRKMKGKGEGEKLTAFEKILSSSIGGALATWNQPIEVVRVEMQSMAKGAERGEKKTILNTLSTSTKKTG
uniref:Probable mitochondrial substrate carrier (Putative mitochondrial carrier protein) n=1 Tax=Ganoderma boninense TaxID=34458 RepID=A0A5K1JRI8_9APHY|nr:Probable mitochondrial substrate carrier (Putative mitochondrial carrier protein) [Ganoderma boninense]